MAPIVAEAIQESGPDLIDTLLPGAALLKRTEEAAPAEAEWLPSLRTLVERKAALPADASLQQGAVFNQVTRVLGAAAKHAPLLLVLEDLHWADAGSLAISSSATSRAIDRSSTISTASTTTSTSGTTTRRSRRPASRVARFEHTEPPTTAPTCAARAGA